MPAQACLNSGVACSSMQIRESGVQSPVARDDRTFGGRSFAYMVTRAPARWSNRLEVSPSAPQPITPISRSPVAIAFCMAIVLEPQESDHPLPPWP